MTRTRDALLAAVVGVACLIGLARWNATSALGRPTAVALGIGSALAVEALFIAGTPAGRLWERPVVQALSLVVVLGGAVTAAVLSGPWILAAVCWGIATYYVLLVLVVTDAWEG